jgi:hypothetical protein
LSDGHQLKLKATFFLVILFCSTCTCPLLISRSLISTHVYAIREEAGRGGKGKINNATLPRFHLFCDDQRASDGALGVFFFSFSFSFSFHTDEAGALRGARPSTYGAKEQDWTWTHWEHCASIEALGDGVSADSTPSPATGFSLTTMGR